MPVCIAGMHRSGTSMVTKMLHTSGLYLGPEADLIPSNPNNPEGHWENKRFVKLNARMLEQLRGSWDYPPPAPDDWADGRFAPYRREAEVLLAEYASREPWGWKDPRNCLTYPFWQSILAPIRVVMVVRNPFEVARSLRERNGFSYALGLALWQTYNRRIWESVAPQDRIVTHYDTYFRDPASELRRVLSFLGLSASAGAMEEARDVRVADLRHHKVTSRDLRAANVAPEIVDLYQTLCEEANWCDAGQERRDPGAADDPETDGEMLRAWGDPNETRAVRRPPSADRPQRRRKLEEAEARIAELEQMVEAQRIAHAKYEVDSGS